MQNQQPTKANQQTTQTAIRMVIMGVSGSGKTCVGKAVADRLGVRFVEADDFHPPANVAKMKQGHPLTDADRQPWLERLNRELRNNRAGCVLGCSALKRAYRQTLERDVQGLRWVHLQADYQTIAQRMRGRDHFMPVDLLQSQFQALEPPRADEALIVDGSQNVDQVVNEVVSHFSRSTGRQQVM